MKYVIGFFTLLGVIYFIQIAIVIIDIITNRIWLKKKEEYLYETEDELLRISPGGTDD